MVRWRLWRHFSDFDSNLVLWFFLGCIPWKFHGFLTSLLQCTQQPIIFWWYLLLLLWSSLEKRGIFLRSKVFMTCAWNPVFVFPHHAYNLECAIKTSWREERKKNRVHLEISQSRHLFTFSIYGHSSQALMPNEFLPTLFSNCSLTFCFGFFAYIMRDLRCKYSSSNSSCQVSTLPSSFKPFKRSFGVTNCLECREVTPLCGKTIFEVCLKSSHHFSS